MHLKYFLFFILLLFLSCSPKEATQNLTEEEKTVAEGLVQGVFDDVWAGLDSTKILSYHTDDFILLEHGEVWTNREIGDYIKKSLTRENRPIRKNRMEFFFMEKYGHAINMAYHNYATFLNNDTLVGRGQWLESATAVKTNNGWKLKSMHSTRVPVNN